MEKDFKYDSITAECSDLRVIFITDEKKSATEKTAVHMHSLWEIFLLLEGDLTVQSEKETFSLQEGNILIVPPNLYHSSYSENGAVKRSGFFTFEKIKSKGALE